MSSSTLGVSSSERERRERERERERERCDEIAQPRAKKPILCLSELCPRDGGRCPFSLVDALEGWKEGGFWKQKGGESSVNPATHTRSKNALKAF